MRTEGNGPKYGEPTCGFFSRQFLSIPVGVVEGFFFSKVRCVKLWTNPNWAGFNRFLPVTSTEISIKRTALLWCHWYNSECSGRAEKAFTKWLPWMFPTSFSSLVEVYSCREQILWRKCSLNGCTVVYFSEIQWFQEHFESTTY